MPGDVALRFSLEYSNELMNKIIIDCSNQEGMGEKIQMSLHRSFVVKTFTELNVLGILNHQF